MADQPPHLNYRDAAAHVGKSVHTIRRWIRESHLTARLRNGEWMVRTADIDVLKNKKWPRRPRVGLYYA